MIKKTLDELIEKIDKKNHTVNVCINRIGLNNCTGWFYDELQECIRTHNNSFFQITGVVCSNNNNRIEQPIIIQNEIGYLGIRRT